MRTLSHARLKNVHTDWLWQSKNCKFSWMAASHMQGVQLESREKVRFLHEWFQDFGDYDFNSLIDATSYWRWITCECKSRVTNALMLYHAWQILLSHWWSVWMSRVSSHVTRHELMGADSQWQVDSLLLTFSRSYIEVTKSSKTSLFRSRRNMLVCALNCTFLGVFGLD